MSESGVAGCLKEALDSGKYSDVQFAVGRQFGQVKIFQSYKNVLGLRSPVFATMFYGSLPESCEVPIEIPDLVPDAFANMLSYMYSDKVENLSTGNVFPTMTCADKYDLPLLTQICSNLLDKQLTPEKCLNILDEAIHWQADAFVEKCWAIVDSKTEEVLRSTKFPEATHGILHIMLQRNTLTAGEFDVYLAVNRWASAACARNNLDPSAVNRRQMLGDVLFLVRFPLLTNSQLAEGPAKTGLLTETELLSLFLYRTAEVKPQVPFPTDSRTEFRVGDEVFAHKPSSRWWFPATVTAVNHRQVALAWFENLGTDTLTADKVIGSWSVTGSPEVQGGGKAEGRNVHEIQGVIVLKDVEKDVV
ncbi:BTB/POZ domain-containing protein 6-B-like [Paramacrobiotus metropolitanus]|uniref:BTB/POZ domain-containing protein 6-B-like n=1 Tax=Paramacrobiotus metropolitanus TaxID=2943436 RepID=UPI002445979E|nr:BTB/POZ domain-containing protein 6-B-like [Paramacrobiotus metropolitanus]